MIGKERIFVTGIGKGAGASTIAILLADGLGKERRTTYMQLDDDLGPYYYLAMDRFKELKSLAKDSARTAVNMVDKLNCLVHLPGERTLEFQEKTKAILAASGEVIVYEDEDLRLGEMADTIIAVVDPLPSLVFQNMGKIRTLKKWAMDGARVIFLVNKVNKGVNLSKLLTGLRITSHIDMEYIDPKDVYSYQFQGKSLLENKAMVKDFEGVYKKILYYV
ncbi:MAG: hypothetical protein MJ146_01335 [Clostridia bacterium]|nr:hypothetical protein [Clostridia bacterium]